jgi:hypothetical protein
VNCPLQLVECGLQWAARQHSNTACHLSKATGPAAEVIRQRALSFRAPGVYTTFLDAWVAARRELQQVPQERVDTVVAAVAASRQPQPQRSWLSVWAAGVCAKLVQVRQLWAGSWWRQAAYLWPHSMTSAPSQLGWGTMSIMLAQPSCREPNTTPQPVLVPTCSLLVAV